MIGINSTTPNVYVDKYVDKKFASNITDKYAKLSEQYGVKDVDSIIILSNADADKIEELTGIDNSDKELLMDYVSGTAKDSYGFYSKKANAFVFMERNHERKDTALEGSIEEQGADTLTHEFGHLFGNANSEKDEFRAAYKEDLEYIYEQLQANPDGKIGDSDMTYREAVSYFSHYMDGADFSDGISNKDITAKGARENYAEAFSVINDTEENASNNIFRTLFSNSINQVSLDCYQ